MDKRHPAVRQERGLISAPCNPSYAIKEAVPLDRQHREYLIVRYGVIHRLIIFAVIVAMPLGASLPAVAAIGDVPPETAGTVLRGFDPLLVKNIQKRLRELGIYVGPADGRMADETAAAIRTYQKLARLNVDLSLIHISEPTRPY